MYNFLFFFSLEQFQSLSHLWPFFSGSTWEFCSTWVRNVRWKCSTLRPPPGCPQLPRRRPGTGCCKEPSSPYQTLIFFFPLLSKILYQWTCWFCFWNPRWCTFYTTLLPLSPILIFLSSIYLKVRSKYVLYEFPMFAIQAIVPLYSKLCDTGRNANISRSARLWDPQLSSPSEKDRADDIRAQICCQGRNTYLETVFKILAKKTKLRHVNHMTQSLYPVHGCQLSRQAERWLASILLVYTHFCLL